MSPMFGIICSLPIAILVSIYIARRVKMGSPEIPVYIWIASHSRTWTLLFDLSDDPDKPISRIIAPGGSERQESPFRISPDSIVGLHLGMAKLPRGWSETPTTRDELMNLIDDKILKDFASDYYEKHTLEDEDEDENPFKDGGPESRAFTLGVLKVLEDAKVVELDKARKQMVQDLSRKEEGIQPSLKELYRILRIPEDVLRQFHKGA